MKIALINENSQVTRSESVTLDIILPVLGADISGEHLQTALCSRVSRYCLASQLRHHGADIDNLAMPLLNHGAAYAEKGIKAHGYVCDVTNEEAVNAMVAQIEKEVGVIDILVNNAGIIKRIPMTDCHPAEARAAAPSGVSQCNPVRVRYTGYYTARTRSRKMKIALINENSQAAKNAMVCETLKKVVEPMGHEVVNYGMYSAEDIHSLTYVQNDNFSKIYSRFSSPPQPKFSAKGSATQLPSLSKEALFEKE